MLGITGFGSQIVVELMLMLPFGETVVAAAYCDQLPMNGDRFLFAQGFLAGRSSKEITEAEVDQTFRTNYAEITEAIDQLVSMNPRARMVVVGSESAYFGSYDAAYAQAKLELHRYVESKRLKHPEQQLVCVSPGIISDAGMTTRRTDLDNLDAKREAHPKRRFVTAAEVARLIKFLLYDDRGYLSGTIIRMNGGEAAWRA